MKIALIGYGKMGKEIEKIALSRGHEIVSIIDVNNQEDFESAAFKSADVAIEFTNPTAAYNNYMKAFKADVKLVSGSTGSVSYTHLLLANPALAWEYQQNRKLSPDEMLSKIKQLHTAIYNSYEEQLQGGETQLLMKMKNFWEYLLPNGNRKAQKAIHKTSKLTNYRIAVNDLLSSYQ